MNEQELDQEIELLTKGINRISVDKRTEDNSNMTTTTAEHLRALVDVAITAALSTQRQIFEAQVTELKNRVQTIAVPTPEIESYREIEIIQGRQCDESLDIVKSLPDFEGKHETYVSWRQAAHTAYKIFENYDGSSKHFQAVAIIRNKIKGPADMVLSSFNTVLNFKAIIARLDFTYSDKRPIYLIEQELSTLRQGNLTLLQFYDEVEKKLTLLTNKTIMTYDGPIATTINAKYRMDALRVFISGTKKELSNVLFSARPSDLPSALALAQEVESNRERYLFATNYAKSREDKERQRGEPQPSAGARDKNPHFTRRQGSGNGNAQRRDTDEPMDVDESSRFRQSTRYNSNNVSPSQGQYNSQTNAQTVKRPNSGTARFTGPKQQRINMLSQEVPQAEQEYHELAASEADDVDVDAADDYDHINFLGMAPCYRT